MTEDKIKELEDTIKTKRLLEDKVAQLERQTGLNCCVKVKTSGHYVDIDTADHKQILDYNKIKLQEINKKLEEW